MLGYMRWVMPIAVAMSAFGGLSVHIMTSSRFLYFFQLNWFGFSKISVSLDCVLLVLDKDIYQICFH